MIEFAEFPKIARLSRQCVITEKIDGTNASVYVPEDAGPLLFGSRTRWITPETDNYGFARWATARAEELRQLGPGHHFGEWWGSGCQRGYGLSKGEKRFSLLNTGRWLDAHHGDDPAFLAGKQRYAPLCCHVVPVLFAGIFHSDEVTRYLNLLRESGSRAAPGFMQPEGVVIWHEGARIYFKKTLEKDEQPKGTA